MANIQLRGTCAACFAQQALRHGRLVQHGYRRPQDWHQNVGTCSGTGHQHFGTEAGRAYTEELASRLLVQADGVEKNAAEVLSGAAQVWEKKRIAFGVSREVVVENPSDVQRRSYAQTLRYRAESMRKTAAEFDTLVHEWKPKEAIEVEVEEKTTLTHWETPSRWGGRGKACAGSCMGAMKGWATREAERVTCPKCKALIERFAAKSAA